MPDRGGDEFYVGYLPQAPGGIASRVRLAVVAVLVVAGALAAVLIVGQRHFARSSFEYGISNAFEGVVLEHPYPALLVQRPANPDGRPAHSVYYLTVFGKLGAHTPIAGLHGKPVKLRGALIYRDDRTMIEIEDGSVEPLSGPKADALAAAWGAERKQDLGTQTLTGEIVDTKCFLGVMKPGNLKPHRSCAVRCISGGVPPALVVRDAEGIATYYLLVSASGGAVNDAVLDLVAEPVEITGKVMRRGDLLLLLADPQTYRRL